MICGKTQLMRMLEASWSVPDESNAGLTTDKARRGKLMNSLAFCHLLNVSKGTTFEN